MARRRAGKRTGEAGATPNAATVGHEAELWAMADALRGSMDAAEYKHVVLGLIFLTPGRYVGAEPQPDDGEPFEAKMRRLVGELQAQRAEGRAA